MKAIIVVLIGFMGFAAVAQENCQQIRWLNKTDRMWDLKNPKAYACAAQVCELAKGSLTSGGYLFTYPNLQPFELQSTKVQNCAYDTTSVPGSLILRTIERDFSAQEAELKNGECWYQAKGGPAPTTCDIKYEQ